MAEPWTVKTLLTWGTEYFKKYNIEWPHLETEILLSHALKVKRIQLYIDFERVLKPEELGLFKDYILRRSKHEPIAYITGTQPFMSLEFKVNPSVLIPRPETEKLVEIVIDIAKEMEAPLIADIGTGSGAIAVSLAKYLPKSKIYATDSSREALEIAETNAKNHKIEDRCQFRLGNLLEPLQDLNGKIDIIVSNPPYVKSGEFESLQPEIRDYEPRSALDGGEDGLKYYRVIIEQSKNFLKQNGCLALEAGVNQSKIIKEIIEKNGFGDIKIIKDYSDIERVLTAKLL